MKRKIFVMSFILLSIFIFFKLYYTDNVYYNKEYYFEFEYPEKWKGKVSVDMDKEHGFTEIIFNYTGYKTPINTYQPFFSIIIVEKTDKYERHTLEKSYIIKENDKYIMTIFRDLGNALAKKEAIEEYRKLELSNDEIIKRIEFKNN